MTAYEDFRAEQAARAGEGDPLPNEPKTELGYAHRLVAAYGDRIRYVAAWRRWLMWDGRRWSEDKEGKVAVLAKQIARCMLIDAVNRDEKDLNRFKSMESARAIKAVLDLASTEPEVATVPDQLDADPYLLNVQNGTFDLRTFGLRPHDPKDLITKIAGAAFSKDASREEFGKFLARVQPDRDMRNYLLRVTGLALCGKITEHILPIFWGEGANGKSTYVAAVRAALGEYADAGDPSLLVENPLGTHPTGVADLFGLRLAVLDETDKARRLAEATVKRLTGGDRIKARRMREDFWSFDPTHSFLMLTNHAPIISGTDEAIWRRLQLIPWEVVIPRDERDPHLGDRLALELDGILTLLIAGYRAYREQGLNPPAKVLAATAGYREESDPLKRFLEETCRRKPGSVVPSQVLYNHWCRWCEGEGEKPGSQTAFAKELSRRGFDKKATMTGKVWLDLQLQRVAGQ